VIVMNVLTDPNALVQRFRPLYRLHSEEMWYPCHPEDQLRCASLLSVEDGVVIIPALRGGEGSVADQFLCTPAGLEQLARRGVHLDASTIADLRWASVPDSPHYAYLRPSSKYAIAREDDGLLPPYGWLASANFQPASATWFHRGAPNNPLNWLGGDPAAYARAALDPPSGTLRGAWQEPVTTAWVQTHTVAGVEYLDLIYTSFLAWNGSISLLAGQGEHPNDVETVIVRLRASDPETPVRFFFQQHGGFAWYDAASVECDGDRVVVYLARQSHECYAHPGRYTRVFGFADDLCDTDGVTWDAPVQFTARPQGIDERGIDTDALRCSLAAGGDPNGIVLVPLDDPGPLWQYVRFPFLARRPATVPLSDDDFLFQPFPLSTTKWWPQEGPAATTGPLAEKAAEPSAPGVPGAFFDDVSAYLGPDPLPVCSGSASPLKSAVATPRLHASSMPAVTTTGSTLTGSAIGGPTAALAPNAPFVDWRGAIGAYLLGAIDSRLPGWLALLPDPLAIGSLSIAGLHGLRVVPAAATSATTVATSATLPRLDITAGSLSLHIDNVVVTATATLITPVAIPRTTPAQWYVPYVGPAPYSYATPPWSITSAISSGTVSSLAITFDDITVDTGSELLDLPLDIFLALIRTTIETGAASALRAVVNTLLQSVYEGTRRVG
jgi:hypothetical protein